MIQFSFLLLAFFSGFAFAVEDFDVEIHKLICEAEDIRVFDALQIDIKPEKRDLYLFDSEQFDFFKKNIILRAYISDSGKKGLIDAKIRPIDLPLHDRWDGDKDNLSCEYDTHSKTDLPGSCRIRKKLDGSEILKVVRGNEKVKNIFSSTQKKFLEKLTTGVHWDNAQVHGPISVKKWEVKTHELSGTLNLEIWDLKNLHLLELSTRVKKSKLSEGYKNFLDFINDQNLKLCSGSKSKLELTIKYLKNLQK